jgi:hypothetical protein
VLARNRRLSVVAHESDREAATTTVRNRRADPTTIGVVSQVQVALHPRNRVATYLGCLLGGIVPFVSYVVAHHEIDTSASTARNVASAALVAGGLLFSARTVYEWGRLAFRAGGKALGFVLLMEGTMIASRTPWLALTALVYLVAVNGIATGCTLSLNK